jgi:shikimate kinase
MSGMDVGDRNIVLIGFMGTGKSTVGRRLARSLRRQFVDTDREVERRSGMSIADLFALGGETAFRDIEADVVLDLSRRRGSVIATGGGTLLRPANRAALGDSIIIALTATPEAILSRTRRHPRPLLRGADPLARIRALLLEREAVYANADLTIDTSALSTDEVAAAIRRQLRLSGRD